LTAAVSSIEDHGYILDIGMDSFKGFLSFKDSREFTPNSISKDGEPLFLATQFLSTIVSSIDR
jgi:hypothetical protein